MASIGAALLSELDRSELDVRAALWLFLPESGRWRYVVATPLIKVDGPRKVLRKIQKIVRREGADFGSLDLMNISAVDPTDPLILPFRGTSRTRRTPSKVRDTGDSVHGVFINDAFVYRML